MAQNPSVTQLDLGQAMKRTYDETNDAIRVEVGSGTSFGLSLTADSGDSVTSVPNVSEIKASITSVSTGVIVAAAPCIGMKSFNLYTKTTGAITDAQVCTLEVSPSDSDNVWKATSLTITPSASNAVVIMGTVNTAIVARRMRVSIATNITAGTFDIYVVAQSV